MNRLSPLLLAIVLAIGGEYQITHTSGRTSFCKVEGVTPEGDYVVRHPKMVRYNNNSEVPIITWDKGGIVISAYDISEAKLLKPPAKPQDSWNRLSGTSYHTPPAWLTNSGLSKPLY
jgi:hypothetical protein